MLATSARPPLTVFVVGRERSRIFETLREVLGLPRWLGGYPPHGRHIELEKHVLHLRDDVHHGHAGACALLVVDGRTGVDADTRLAVLHARREGLHHFVLVIDERHTNRRSDAVERDVRHLIEELDLEGNAVPVVRVPMYRFGKALSEATRAGVRELLAALDDLPAAAAPAPLCAAPPAFAAEAALLDAVLQLFAPATLLRLSQHCSYDESLELRGGSGGSYLGGATYLERDEPWPHCPRCSRPMAGTLQIDTRDFLHEVPPGHGLFAAFTCDGEGCDGQEVRHHLEPCAERRRREPPLGRTQLTDFASVFVADSRGWVLPESNLLVAEHPDAAARLHALTGEDPVTAFSRVAACIGADSVAGQHFGGYHSTQDSVPTPRCRDCGDACLLVATFGAGLTRDHSLWACREHPSSGVYMLHG